MLQAGADVNKARADGAMPLIVASFPEQAMWGGGLDVPISWIRAEYICNFIVIVNKVIKIRDCDALPSGPDLCCIVIACKFH